MKYLSDLTSEILAKAGKVSPVRVGYDCRRAMLSWKRVNDKHR